jgi:preprotein translocase subunit SecG
MNILIGLLTAVHIVVALILIVLVLMQKSSEQGVGAAFGGGVTETVFGGGTTSALVQMTKWCAGLMLGITLLLAVLHSKKEAHQSLMQKTLATPSGAAVPFNTPAPASAPKVLPITTPEANESKPAATPPPVPAGEKKP